MKQFAFILALFAYLFAQKDTAQFDFIAQYSDEMKEYWPISVHAYQWPKDLRFETETLIKSKENGPTCTLRRTTGDLPYEKTLCLLTIKSGSVTQQLTAKGFRTVEARWLNNELLFVALNIAHLVSVEAIWNVREGKFLYCRTVRYVPTAIPH
jgi:hypothetical protein